MTEWLKFVNWLKATYPWVKFNEYNSEAFGGNHDSASISVVTWDIAKYDFYGGYDDSKYCEIFEIYGSGGKKISRKGKITFDEMRDLFENKLKLKPEYIDRWLVKKANKQKGENMDSKKIANEWRLIANNVLLREYADLLEEATGKVEEVMSALGLYEGKDKDIDKLINELYFSNKGISEVAVKLKKFKSEISRDDDKKLDKGIVALGKLFTEWVKEGYMDMESYTMEKINVKGVARIELKIWGDLHGCLKNSSLLKEFNDTVKGVGLFSERRNNLLIYIWDNN